jgi:hypothetical protein
LKASTSFLSKEDDDIGLNCKSIAIKILLGPEAVAETVLSGSNHIQPEFVGSYAVTVPLALLSVQILQGLKRVLLPVGRFNTAAPSPESLGMKLRAYQ